MRYWMKVIVAATALSASFVAAICGIVVGVSRLPEPAGRGALIDRYGGDGGKRAAVGLKATPGPLYGVKKDVWSALALVVMYAEKRASDGADGDLTERERERDG